MCMSVCIVAYMCTCMHVCVCVFGVCLLECACVCVCVYVCACLRECVQWPYYDLNSQSWSVVDGYNQSCSTVLCPDNSSSLCNLVVWLLSVNSLGVTNFLN